MTATCLFHLQVGAARTQECFKPLRSSDHDALLDRVSSPPSVLKALAPPPGTSFIGTFRPLGLGWACFSVPFEFSQSSYGCGPLRSWNSAIVVSSGSNGTWEGRPIELRSGGLSDVPPPRSAFAPCASRYFSKTCITSTFVHSSR